jgi:hypothetical protein
MEELGELVYIVRAGRLYKIGRTMRFPRRYRALQTASPHPLEVVCLLYCPTCGDEAPTDPRESVGLERYLHHAFAHRRVNGEWFRLTKEDLHRINHLHIWASQNRRYVMPEGPFSHYDWKVL